MNIQVYIKNLIKIKLGEVTVHFEPVMDTNCQTGSSTLTRQTSVNGLSKVSYDVPGELLHYSHWINLKFLFNLAKTFTWNLESCSK